ncbi:hypothetical protein EW026_g3490 [Hermanssonia centrifuga]|uniref:RTA1-domain-containing protein n=1 Tax=Hermanssonia centrifuga TaxID=98765 RepID=A0A4S4KJZ6_9APHY|nr:hypothetical protein EW026_g3490 [Hermanssonia centrifuga]
MGVLIYLVLPPFDFPSHVFELIVVLSAEHHVFYNDNNTNWSVHISHVLTSPYNYTPTESVAIIFLVLFSISTIFHIFAALRYRLWWLIPTACLAATGEVIGWAGRLWSSQNVLANDPFMMQIVCTIIAPTPFVAAIFILFGHLVRRLGEGYSMISARWYSRIFLTCDLIALFIQAVGGGIASSANTVAGTNLGATIMQVGIIIQLIALVIFMFLFVEFFGHFLRDRPFSFKRGAGRSTATLVSSREAWTGRVKLFTISLAFSTFVLFIRAIYRTIELSDGWNGPVISTQKWFNIFDGTMVVLALYSMNIFHPGYMLFNQPFPSDLHEMQRKDATVDTLSA